MPQSDNRLDPGGLQFTSHPHVLLDCRFIIDALFWLNPRPLDAKAVMVNSQLAESSQVPVEVRP